MNTEEREQLVEDYQKIVLAKQRLEALGFDAAAFKARYDKESRQEQERHDNLRTEAYFEYGQSLIYLIRRNRCSARYVSSRLDGHFLRLQVRKRLKQVEVHAYSHGCRLRWDIDEGQIRIGLQKRYGRKGFATQIPLDARLHVAPGAVIVKRDQLERNSVGTIWRCDYICLKNMVRKLGYFAEDTRGDITRCAGLPSARKHLRQAATKLYAEAL